MNKYNVKVGDKYNHWTVLEVLGYGGKCRCQCDCEDKTIKTIRTDTLVCGSSKSCGCTQQKVHVDDVYGRLKVLELNVRKTKSGISLHKCQCECGNICYVSSGNLRNGHTQSCGCYNKERIHEALFQDLTGKRIGRLVVLSIFKEGNYWKCKCRCDCGNETVVLAKDLRNKATHSCGCFGKEQRLKALTTSHNLSNSKFYYIYKNMIRRCNDIHNKRYKDYGGRGIKVCDEWLQFENFYQDMYDNYLSHIKEYGEFNTTIDRIDVNGDYCKENCRWATWQQQARNKTNTWYITFNGETKSALEWAEILNLSINTIRNRKYHRGITNPKLLLDTSHKHSKKGY